MYVFCFQTCFAAYKHTRISAKAQLFLHLPKGFLQGRTVQCKYVALFLLFFIFKMKKKESGHSIYESAKHTLISLFWLQEAKEPCLSVESPGKTIQRLIHVFIGYTGKCRKSCALATCVLMQQITVENKIHTCYEIKQLNVKTCFCVFKV